MCIRRKKKQLQNDLTPEQWEKLILTLKDGFESIYHEIDILEKSMMNNLDRLEKLIDKKNEL